MILVKLILKQLKKHRIWKVYNPFTKHPTDNAGESWWVHCKFSVSIGFRLLLTSFYFIIHGLFPFIKIPKWVNLTDSALYLLNENKKRL